MKSCQGIFNIKVHLWLKKSLSSKTLRVFTLGKRPVMGEKTQTQVDHVGLHTGLNTSLPAGLHDHCCSAHCPWSSRHLPTTGGTPTL